MEMKCSESDEEKPTTSHESFLQLSCFISQDVKYMLSGIKSVRHQLSQNVFGLEILKTNFFFSFQKLQEQLTKQSATLGRDAVYIKTVN